MKKILPNIRQCIDMVDIIWEHGNTGIVTKEEDEFMKYFELNLAKAIMKDINDSEKIAKIILATKGLENKVEISIK